MYILYIKYIIIFYSIWIINLYFIFNISFIYTIIYIIILLFRWFINHNLNITTHAIDIGLFTTMLWTFEERENTWNKSILFILCWLSKDFSIFVRHIRFLLIYISNLHDYYLCNEYLRLNCQLLRKARINHLYMQY